MSVTLHYALKDATDDNARKLAARWGALYVAAVEISYPFFGITIFGNMNVEAHRRGYRRVDVVMLVIVVIPTILYAAIPGVSAIVVSVLGILFIIAGAVFVRAKATLINNYSHVELKKHMLMVRQWPGMSLVASSPHCNTCPLKVYP